MMNWRQWVTLTLMAGAVIHATANGQRIAPRVTLASEGMADQDDMAIWQHPDDPARSAIITSDKAAGKLFVYDLEGNVLQTVTVEGKPGNIDLRYGFPLDGKQVDIIAFNERDHSAIHVYKMDGATRTLSRVDDGKITTGNNYGFTLYHSRKSGNFYAVTVPEREGSVEQYELTDNGNGQIRGKKVRSWPFGKSEGCVADDENGWIFIGEEEAGIWKVGAEPDAASPGSLIIPLGDHDFVADVEGLAICYGANGGGFLIASSQGNGSFKVFNRKAPHDFVRSFSVEGAAETDGIDVLNAPLGAAFPNGIFTLHNGAIMPCPVVVCDLADLGLANE